MFLHRSLTCFEIVFIFLRQVQQLIFLILFGLSYNYENWHRNKRNIIDSQHHIYFRKPVTIATIWRIQLSPWNRDLCLILKRDRWKISSQLILAVTEEMKKVYTKRKQKYKQVKLRNFQNFESTRLAFEHVQHTLAFWFL